MAWGEPNKKSTSTYVTIRYMRLCANEWPTVRVFVCGETNCIRINWKPLECSIQSAILHHFNSIFRAFNSTPHKQTNKREKANTSHAVCHYCILKEHIEHKGVQSVLTFMQLEFGFNVYSKWDSQRDRVWERNWHEQTRENFNLD